MTKLPQSQIPSDNPGSRAADISFLCGLVNGLLYLLMFLGFFRNGKAPEGSVFAVLFCMFLLFPIAGLVLAIVSLRQARTRKRRAWIGLILALIGTAVPIILIVIIILSIFTGHFRT